MFRGKNRLSCDLYLWLLKGHLRKIFRCATASVLQHWHFQQYRLGSQRAVVPLCKLLYIRSQVCSVSTCVSAFPSFPCSQLSHHQHEQLPSPTKTLGQLSSTTCNQLVQHSVGILCFILTQRHCDSICIETHCKGGVCQHDLDTDSLKVTQVTEKPSHK